MDDHKRKIAGNRQDLARRRYAIAINNRIECVNGVRNDSAASVFLIAAELANEYSVIAYAISAMEREDRFAESTITENFG